MAVSNSGRWALMKVYFRRTSCDWRRVLISPPIFSRSAYAVRETLGSPMLFVTAIIASGVRTKWCLVRHHEHRLLLAKLGF